MRYATVHALVELLIPEDYVPVEVMRLYLRGGGYQRRQQTRLRRVGLFGDPKRREILNMGSQTIRRSGELQPTLITKFTGFFCK